MKNTNKACFGTLARLVLLALICAASAQLSEAQDPFIGQLNTVQVLASTVPTNGDVNPYGVFRVPVSGGS